jgi:hypothetical protein
LTKTIWALIFGLVTLSSSLPAFTGDPGGAAEDPETARIISKYVAASQAPSSSLRGVSMEVDISASVPELQKHGKLHALQNISKLGQITYKVLGFQGDDTVKKDVIARYLTAEQQSQSDNSMAVIPANYKFKFKGKRDLPAGNSAYVLQVAPKKKAVGLFKGEIWLDAESCLIIFEKGRLVKNPTVFFKRVDFERAFEIQNGVAVPQHMNSIIDTRLVGKIELNIDYSHLAPENDPNRSALSTRLFQ